MNEIKEKLELYHKDNCGSSEKCWIPQMDQSLSPNLSSIKPCTSWQSYNCMLKGYINATWHSSRCPHDCEIPYLSMINKDVYMPPYNNVSIKKGILRTTSNRWIETIASILEWRDAEHHHQNVLLHNNGGAPL